MTHTHTLASPSTTRLTVFSTSGSPRRSTPSWPSSPSRDALVSSPQRRQRRSTLSCEQAFATQSVSQCASSQSTPLLPPPPHTLLRDRLLSRPSQRRSPCATPSCLPTASSRHSLDFSNGAALPRYFFFCVGSPFFCAICFVPTQRFFCRFHSTFYLIIACFSHVILCSFSRALLFHTTTGDCLLSHVHFCSTRPQVIVYFLTCTFVPHDHR
jgi:hypothetical protein